MISSAAYACTERDNCILQNTISSTERGAMIAWLETACYWPIPNWASDEDVKRIFWKMSDKQGGFVKAVLVTVTHGQKSISTMKPPRISPDWMKA